MKTTYSLGLASLAAAVLTACSGGSNDVPAGPTIDLSTARGTIVANSPAILAAFPSAADYKAALSASASGRSLLGAAGDPKCGVTFHYMQYNTVGGANEVTNGSAGIMVPSGSDPACSGPRPVLLYAHGTTVEKNYNFASPANSETALIAAMYAAQGWIVVGPSYVGYESSNLPYHPYLNAEAQSNDMIDAMRAARKAFPNIGASASDKLFLSGYSQGGYVAMATAKAMQSPTYSGEFKVTALGGMSGPYSMVKTLQTVFAGGVNAGATVFSPLIFTSWQKAYGNIYASTSDVYEAPYATGIETLLPNPTLTFNTLFTTGKLPTKLFATGALVTGNPSLDALFAAGVGTPNLIKQSYRQAVIAGGATHPVAVAAAKNDLTGWTPSRPTAMCMGAADPTVFASNTSDAATAFGSRGVGALIKVFNVEDAASVGPQLAGAFAAAKAATAADPNAPGANAAEKVVQAYHGSLVPPFCNLATRAYFQGVLAAGL
jgi:Secretory lipase